mmetsp:Transcript_94371/g.275955  ORF Transcript_94371/g.275955 Transcript_94371/m.275955 type:complete len:254 (-) Transcript_94371:25-786(-)
MPIPVGTWRMTAVPTPIANAKAGTNHSQEPLDSAGLRRVSRTWAPSAGEKLIATTSASPASSPRAPPPSQLRRKTVRSPPTSVIRAWRMSSSTRRPSSASNRTSSAPSPSGSPGHRNAAKAPRALRKLPPCSNASLAASTAPGGALEEEDAVGRGGAAAAVAPDSSSSTMAPTERRARGSWAKRAESSWTSCPKAAISPRGFTAAATRSRYRTSRSASPLLCAPCCASLARSDSVRCRASASASFRNSTCKEA